LQGNSNISSAVNEVSNALNHVTGQRVFFGNALNQLQSQANSLNSEKVDLATAANTISAADPATVATQLTQSQVAVSAELSAISRISQNSLFDYLK